MPGFFTFRERKNPRKEGFEVGAGGSRTDEKKPLNMS